MARLVRCPKCTKLLVENPEVPVYKCGGCQTVLRAKNHKPVSENAVASSSQTSSVSTSPEHALSEVGSISSGTNVLSSSLQTPSPIQEEFTGGSPNRSLPDVVSENGFSDKEMPPPCSSAASAEGDHEEEGERPNGGPRDSTVNDKHIEINESLELETKLTEADTQQVEVTESEKDDCSNDQVVNAHETSSEVVQSLELVAQGTDSKEDIVDTDKQDHVTKALANMSPETYDGSVSSSDDGRRENRHPLSRRTTRRWSNKSTVRDKEKNVEMDICLGDEDSARFLLSKSGKESEYFDVLKSFNDIKQEIVSRYQSGELGLGRSFDSAEFQSVDSWMDSERIKPYESPTRGHFSDHMELLRKVDELKAQIIGLYTERNNNIGGYRSSLPPSYMREYDRNRSYEYSQMPFSGHTHCSCLHCLENHQTHSNSLNSGSSSIQSQKTEKSRSNDKQKRLCRPVSGAAPFVICYHCMKLLQLPADFIISRKKLHKLQCGACNEMLMLSFPHRAPSSQAVKWREVSYSTEAKGDIPPRLHRLMGYDSATELLYTRNDFDEGYDSAFSPARSSYRPSTEFRGRVGGVSGGGGSRYGEQGVFSSNSLAMGMRDGYDSASRLRAAMDRLRSAKDSPNSV